jgi:hypothetical protein
MTSNPMTAMGRAFAIFVNDCSFYAQGMGRAECGASAEGMAGMPRTPLIVWN